MSAEGPNGDRNGRLKRSGRSGIPEWLCQRIATNGSRESQDAKGGKEHEGAILEVNAVPQPPVPLETRRDEEKGLLGWHASETRFLELSFARCVMPYGDRSASGQCFWCMDNTADDPGTSVWLF